MSTEYVHRRGMAYPVRRVRNKIVHFQHCTQMLRRGYNPALGDMASRRGNSFHRRSSVFSLGTPASMSAATAPVEVSCRHWVCLLRTLWIGTGRILCGRS